MTSSEAGTSCPTLERCWRTSSYLYSRPPSNPTPTLSSASSSSMWVRLAWGTRDEGGLHFEAAICNFLQPDQMNIEMCVIDLSFSFKESLRSGRYVLCALFLRLPFSSFVFCVFYFRFCKSASTWKYNIFGYGKYISQRFRCYNDSLHYTCLFCHTNWN